MSTPAINEVQDKSPAPKRPRLSPRTRKMLAWLLGLLLVAYCAFAVLVLWSMHQPPETFGKVMAKMPGPVPFLLFPFETAWTDARSGNLQTGDRAPDFSLLKVDKSERIDLSELNRTQPVVLVFGSYT
jgi:predicted outer membrane lipoprotein